jgi:hypothetical protein
MLRCSSFTSKVVDTSWICCCCRRHQMESIEALSNLINRAEGAMVSSRQTYESAIAARNNTGELVAELASQPDVH